MSHKAHAKQVVEHAPEYVAAPIIAKRFSVTSRYILQLAAAGKIPCIRLGFKCVRFNPQAVAIALGIEQSTGGARL
jgi:hypothetical protein